MIINAQTNTYQETKILAYNLIGHTIHKGTPGEQMDARKEKVNKRKYDAHIRKSGKRVIKQSYTKTPKTYAGSPPQCSKSQYHHIEGCRELVCKNGDKERACH